MTQHQVEAAPTAPGPGWFPDPAAQHELRYFDSAAWTDHVADGGSPSEARLGPVPPGLTAWFPPDVMARSATKAYALEEVPHVKMWILALLSAMVFWSRTPDSLFVFPIGICFAVWCWRATSDALRTHTAAGSPAVTEIKAARWVAVGLAVVSITQVLLWAR